MRIMDFNLSIGSYYVNTINYPTMEDDVQQSIVDVIDKLSIEKEDVVLYGGSKGGRVLYFTVLVGITKVLLLIPLSVQKNTIK